MAQRQFWWTLAAGWLMVILWLTLRSAPDQAARVMELPWYCVLCGEAGVADIILNLLLFAPLGVAAAALQLPRWRAFAFAVALTVAIETIQAKFLVGRDGSLGDVFANSGGAVLGWLLYPGLRQLGRPSPAVARAGVAVVLCLSTATWFATGIGLQPALSTAVPWVGQLQHQWPGHDAFPGTINAAAINGVAVPNDPLDRPASLGKSVDLHVMLTRTLPLPARRTSLVRIVDGLGHPQISLAESGADLIAELQLRASRWGFHTPEWGISRRHGGAGGQAMAGRRALDQRPGHHDHGGRRRCKRNRAHAPVVDRAWLGVHPPIRPSGGIDRPLLELCLARLLVRIGGMARRSAALAGRCDGSRVAAGDAAPRGSAYECAMAR